MPNPPDHEETLFLAAREITDPAQRAAFLDRACRSDPALRERLERLLAADGPAARLWADDPATSDPQTLRIEEPEPVAEGPGSVIGRYKLLEQIGEGGMGVVYMAEQEEPVRRRVALKIIKLGMDTRSVVARFEAERQALALMDHPHIAKVMDAGATDTGRPFFVMELVRGIPITQFCDKTNLTTRQRLELFMPVCQAIQHAHQKGIIHRDIKPTNILVTLNDGVPHPIVIDFGIAKATHQRLTEKTLFTQFAQMIGTPAYMSPEQAEMSKLDVDTRSDVYSLGVLLYELLTGTTPFSERRLRSLGYAEMQRVIAEEEPPRPSTRLSTLTDVEKRELIKRHKEDLRSMSLLFRQELDWVVMKALEKDRGRRYETANALAMDVKRYLEGRAIEAAPPTWSYQFYKLAKRHKRAVATTAAIVVMLVGASVFSTYQAVRATRAEDAALTSAEEARQQSAISEAVIKFLRDDILAAGDVWNANVSPTPDLTLQRVLELARRDLDSRFPGQPLVEASVRLVLGEAQGSVANAQEALRNYQRALELFMQERGPLHRDTLKARRAVGWRLSWEGSGAQIAEGEKLLIEAYEDGLKVLGREDPDTLDFMRMLGQHYLNWNKPTRAEPLIEQAHSIALSTFGPDHKATLDAMYHLAALREAQARRAEARKLWQDLHQAYLKKYGPRDVRVVNVAFGLGSYLWWADRAYDVAASFLNEALNISIELQGIKYPTGNLLWELAQVRIEQQDFHEARALHRQLLADWLQQFSPDHPLSRDIARESASVCARTADWTNLIAELEWQREQGIPSIDLIAWQLLAHHLTDDARGAVRLRQLLWRHVVEDPDWIPDYHTASILAALPVPDGELEPLIGLSDRGTTTGGADKSSGLTAQLLQAWGAFLRGRFAQSSQLLYPLAHSLEQRRIAVFARYFLAVSLHKEGKTEEAKKTLTEANDLFARVLRSGDLDDDIRDPPRPGVSPRSRTWVAHPPSLLIRKQAETLILGRSVSTEITSNSLAVARQAWKPVHDALTTVTQAARRQDYVAARDAYLLARQHPNYDLEAAFDDFPWMIEWMPLVFVQAGDQDGFLGFMREACREEGTLPLRYTLALAYPGWELPADLGTRLAASVSELARVGPSSADKVEGWWLVRDLGIAQLRLGNTQEALKLLENAAQSPNHDCSVSAKAFAALAAANLGQIAEARKWRKEAEEGLRIRVDAGSGVLDPHWWHMAAVDLAVKEGRTDGNTERSIHGKPARN